MDIWPSDYNYNILDYGNGAYHVVKMQSNERFYTNWYIDGEFKGYSASKKNGSVYTASFAPDSSDLTADDVTGTAYEIKASAWSHEPDENGNPKTASDSYTLKVHKPSINAGYGEDTSVYGYTELSLQSYDHPYITFNATVWAENWTEFDWESSSYFRHTVTGPNSFVEQRESTPPTQGITKNGGMYGPYNEDYTESMAIDITSGGRGSYTSDVYIRHSVEGNVGRNFLKDSWGILTQATFHWE